MWKGRLMAVTNGTNGFMKLLPIIMAVITAVSVTYAIAVRGSSVERAADAKTSALEARATAASSMVALADFKIDQAGRHSTTDADIKEIRKDIAEIKDLLKQYIRR